jgi:Vitamin B12 dependent methionine synthase, activation domain
VREWDLPIDADMVLRAQGADPVRLRARKSATIAVAERAVATGVPLLHPAVTYRYLEVTALRHERLMVGAGASSYLSGPLIAQHLCAARRVVVMVCTIGPHLEAEASARAADDLALAVALDAVGSTAVDLLATTACHWVDERARADGLRTTIPLSPGLLGWPVAMGQRELFALLEHEEMAVRLTESWMMVPRKSTSLVIGVGPDVVQSGDPCDYCSMHATCRYREEHQRHLRHHD